VKNYRCFRFEECVMKLTLSSHVVAQVVGGELLLLDSTTQSVYSLALADVVDHSDDFRSLTVSDAAAGFAVSLCEEGLATTTTSGLSRRALVGTGGAAVGAGLLALSLPTAAAASSPGGAGSGPTLSNTFTNGTIGFGSGESANEFIVSVTGDVSTATSASLVHTFPTSFIATSPVSPILFLGEISIYRSDQDLTQFRFLHTSDPADLFSAPWTMTLTYTFTDGSTGTMTGIRQAV